jgi:valacyclovir hydrolase
MWAGWIAAIERFSKQKGGNICQECLPKIKCPTLIIHGEKDPMVPSFHPEYLHKHIAWSTLHLMPEGRHNLHLRYADEFNLVVSKFLKEETKN